MAKIIAINYLIVVKDLRKMEMNKINNILFKISKYSKAFLIKKGRNKKDNAEEIKIQV